MNGIDPLGQLSPAIGLLTTLPRRGAFTLAALPGRVNRLLPISLEATAAATAVAAAVALRDAIVSNGGVGLRDVTPRCRAKAGVHSKLAL